MKAMVIGVFGVACLAGGFYLMGVPIKSIATWTLIIVGAFAVTYPLTFHE